jgi:hypothetical protein
MSESLKIGDSVISTSPHSSAEIAVILDLVELPEEGEMLARVQFADGQTVDILASFLKRTTANAGDSDVTGWGRNRLLAEIARVRRERNLYFENLTATQARCTELLVEVRALRADVEEIYSELIADRRRREHKNADG